MDEKIKEVAEYTITYFRNNFIPKGTEINYELVDENNIKFKIPKDLYNEMTAKLKDDNFDFSISPQDRKMELTFPHFNGKKLLKTKHFNFTVFFVDPAALKTVESIKNNEEKNIKDWSDFFESIEPEYRNLFKKIIDGIPIAVHKNEYNKIIAKKAYWLDYKDGLFEKKEKFVNDEWIITYGPVTQNLIQVFRMFFKYFENVTLDVLADFSLFKEIVSQTKYKTYL